MTNAQFPTARDAQAAGWFSRRHETNADHRAAAEEYRTNKGRKARQRRAAERTTQVSLSALERLFALNTKPGNCRKESRKLSPLLTEKLTES